MNRKQAVREADNRIAFEYQAKNVPLTLTSTEPSGCDQDLARKPPLCVTLMSSSVLVAVPAA